MWPVDKRLLGIPPSSILHLNLNLNHKLNYFIQLVRRRRLIAFVCSTKVRNIICNALHTKIYKNISNITTQ